MSRATNLLIVLMVLLIAGVSKASAQDPLEGHTPSAMTPGSPAGSYALSGLERINYFNGSLSFALPLLLVNGRGDAGTTVTLALETHWSVKHRPSDGTTRAALDSWSDIKPGYGPGVLLARSVSEGSICTGGLFQQVSTTRLTFTAPDRTEIEMRDTLRDGQPYTLFCSTGALSRGFTFVSTDGSGATFISDTEIRDNLGPGSGVSRPSGSLLFRDGRRFRIDAGLVTWIQDRNGNRLTFTYEESTFVQPRVTSITDSLNRRVTFSYETTDIISFTGFGGASRSIQVTHASLGGAFPPGSSYTLKTRHELFPEVDVGGDLNNPDVVSSVVLPNGQSYHFYYNPYAELEEVSLPTGGRFRYFYAAGLVDGAASGFFFQTRECIYRRLIEQQTLDEDGALLSVTTISRPEGLSTNTGFVEVQEKEGDGVVLRHQRHFYFGSPRDSLNRNATSYSIWSDGKEFRTETYGAGPSLLHRLDHIWEQRAHVAWWTNGPGSEPSKDPRIINTQRALDNGLVSQELFGYDAYNNVTMREQYDFAGGAPGGRLRRVETDYVTVNGSANYATDLGIHIRDLPAQERIFDGDLVLGSRTTFEYDNYATAPLVNRAILSGRASPDAHGTGYITRGNATSIRRLVDQVDQTGGVEVEIVTRQEYDIAGNVTKAINGRGYATTFDYDDRFGSPDGEARSNNPPAQLGGFQTFAFATRVTNAKSYTAFAQFDYSIGQTVDAEDNNGVVSSASFDDPLDRPTQTILANSIGILRSQTLFSYDDDARVVTIERDRDAFGDQRQRSEVVYDSLGREAESRLYEDATNFIATKKGYDGRGRFVQVSNPFRPSTESAVFTNTSYDGLDRVVLLETPDGAQTITTYTGNLTTVKDPAGKFRKSGTDALGRVGLLVEDPRPENTSGLNLFTTYRYDVRDNLVSVTQDNQTRTFGYDFLSRMTSSTNPESGQVLYVNDENGNLKRRTDARGVVTVSEYDEIDRIISRTYSDGTPAVGYTYDAVSIPNAIGRLRSVSSSVSTMTYDYDGRGRISRSIQTTAGQNYTVSYGYDLASNLTSETYPSGRVVQTTYDTAGRINTVRDALQLYADQPDYAPHGGLRRLHLGNTLWQQTAYNARLQTRLVGLGNTSPGPNLFNLTNDYGTTDNNGNIHSQSLIIPGATFNWGYSYDDLNRLKTAAESGQPNPWSQTYSFDRFGNRAVTAGVVLQPGLTPQSLNDFSIANNRLTNAQYDTAGNLRQDQIGRIFTYDGENRQTGAATATYDYDGDGRRVRSTVNGSSLIFVYDAFGKLVSEFGGVAPTTTNYLTQDALGSLRIVTNSSGVIVGRLDYLPFGEEIPVTFGGRSSIPGYGSDSSVRQKFTGKERDLETGLDYFLARYMSGPQARFQSADPENAGAVRTDPQTWNAYTYVRDNPLRYVDKTGLAVELCDPNGNCMQGYSDQNFKKNFLSDPSISIFGRYIFKDGKFIGTAERTSFDDLSPLAQSVYSQLTAWRDPMKYSIAILAGGSIVAGTGLGAGEVLLGAAGGSTVTTVAVGVGPPIVKGVVEHPEAQNFVEQMVLKAIESGAGRLSMEHLDDAPRLKAVYGPGQWVKIEYVHRFAKDATGKVWNVTAHAFKNLNTGAVVEPKIVNRPPFL